ncbi:MAG: peptide ABC transporter substrate-binding protein, partial [Dehalococcoidia bacterium]
MRDWTVSELAQDFKEGRISRRHFIVRMLSVGLTAPVIAGVLAACGSSTSNNTNKAGTTSAGSAGTTAVGTAASGSATASTSAKDTFQPAKRGGGGTLKLLWWQGPTTLNAHISTGTKDFDGSRIFTEPLAAWDADSNLFPILAAEIPSIEKGTVAKDGTSVTWKLKQGVQWHDGQPFNADDVVFTFQYVTDPATASTSVGVYKNVGSVEKVDDATVKVTFKEPTPYWQGVFTAGYGHIFPKHLLEQYKGANARNSPFNLKPVGTGAYKVIDFKPGDSITAEINQNYHVPNRPFFDRIELKGGGDATSAARAVLQTGDYDYAWNLQVTDDILKELEKTGQGKVVIYPGGSSEHVQLNPTDPNTEVDGEKSSLKSKHPFLSDPAVRKAFTFLFDRKTLAEQLYGRTGAAATYYLYNPKKYVPDSPSTWEFNLQKGGQMLDDAGWKKGSDGVRAKNGVKMKALFQTSV